jgi:hypothetical protein
MKMKDDITLRDYFAGQVIAGIAALETINGSEGELAELSYFMADMLIKERDKKDEG